MIGALLDGGAESILDLGCGSGALLKRAAGYPQFRHVVGVEASGQALAVARRELAPHLHGDDATVSLINASILDEGRVMTGFDAAVLVETIEHLDPRRLAALEKILFTACRPETVVLTTPNREYNVLYGLNRHELRDADHCFEWTRLQFRSWATRIARQHGYRVLFANIGEYHPHYGTPSQAARFTRSVQHRDRVASH